MERNIATLLDTSDEWIFGDCVVRHPSGIGLWVGNSFPFFALYEPAKQRFSLVWKFRLWRKLGQCKRRIAARKMEKYITPSPKDSYTIGDWVN